MCGICCICSVAPVSDDKQCPFLNMEYVRSRSFISRRGPDIDKSVSCEPWPGIQALFAGFVLHLRGSITPQPLTDTEGNILLWNGEIFSGIEVKDDENDTQILFNRLVKCETQEDVLSVVRVIQGPWSLLFWQAKKGRLWFGRDVFGRRSLLWHLPQGDDDVFALSSVPVTPLDFAEVPSVGMFCMESCQHQDQEDGAQPSGHPLLHLHLYPWQRATWPGTDQDVTLDNSQTVAHKLHLDLSTDITVSTHSDQAVDSWMPVLNCETSEDGSLLNIADCMPGSGDLMQILMELEKKGELTTLVTQLENVLQTAVRKRVHNLPRSCHRNGHGESPRNVQTGANDKVDSVCDSHATLNSQSEFQQSFIGSVNCTCHSSSFASSDNINSSNTSSSVLQLNHHTTVHQNSGDDESSLDQAEVSDLASHGTDTSVTIPDGGGELSKQINCNSDSVEQLNLTGDRADMRSHLQTRTKPAHVAILFSGGVDSTVLAALADRCVPPDEGIDLINVAFEQKISRAPQLNKKKGDQASHVAATPSPYNVPDRQTGYQALSELSPHRCWNFVEVNVTQDTLQKQRSNHVRHLVYPLNTVLDDSIGCAVWFAARGEGVLGNGPNKGAPYTSTARVILCGMGADEQLAGYSRHRVRFQQESWQGLIAEINMEVHRISARNLGRDDRIITDHGKESRFPFLDEDVVAFLASLPVHHKADLRFPRGVGEKLLLRLLALRLRLPATSALPKRAIQFGSRIAKLEQSKEKGSQVCQRLAQE